MKPSATSKELTEYAQSTAPFDELELKALEGYAEQFAEQIEHDRGTRIKETETRVIEREWKWLLSSAEREIVDFIYAKTKLFNKSEDFITESMFMRGTTDTTYFEENSGARYLVPPLSIRRTALYDGLTVLKYLNLVISRKIQNEETASWKIYYRLDYAVSTNEILHHVFANISKSQEILGVKRIRSMLVAYLTLVELLNKRVKRKGTPKTNYAVRVADKAVTIAGTR